MQLPLVGTPPGVLPGFGAFIALRTAEALGLAVLPDISTVKAIMTANPETMKSALDKIDKTYGSFGAYLAAALKLSDSDLNLLRERLLTQ